MTPGLSMPAVGSLGWNAPEHNHVVQDTLKRDEDAECPELTRVPRSAVILCNSHGYAPALLKQVHISLINFGKCWSK